METILTINHITNSIMSLYDSLASVRETECLVLAAGYRDVSDLYNKMTPVFFGPLKIFISNNIKTSEYAESVSCPVYIIGSNADTTLNASLQEKVVKCFENSKLKIFNDIHHEDYFINDNVINYIKEKTSV